MAEPSRVGGGGGASWHTGKLTRKNPWNALSTGGRSRAELTRNRDRLYVKNMSLPARPWIVAIILGLLAGCSDSPQDNPSAEFEKLKAKAERGDAEAQYKLGKIHPEGEGKGKDLAQSFKWYRKAAEQGHAQAQSGLGFCYELGLGVAKDMTQAISWYRKGAQQGDALYQRFLGNCYVNGRGLEKDSSQAVMWYRKAADQDDAPAQLVLGYCYSVGEGISRDMVQAAFWFRKASEQGQADALYYLGNCLSKGEGVAKDEIEAYACWNLAGVTNEDARANFSMLEKKLSREEVAAGQKRTKELQKEIDSKIAAKQARK